MAEDHIPLSAVTKELVRLTDLDYERTAKVIEGVIGTAGTTRGLLLTAWAAVIALAFDTSQWTLAAASLAIIVVSGLLDAYHSWVYNQALRHATMLEKIAQQYHTTLSRGTDDPYAETDLKIALNHHHFGVYSNIHEFKWKRPLLQALRPRVFFQVLYPGMLLISIVALAVLAATATTQKCYNLEVQAAPTVGASGGSVPGGPSVTLLAPGERLSACVAQNG